MLSPLHTLGLLQIKGIGTKSVLRAQRLSAEVSDQADLVSLMQRVKERYPKTQVTPDESAVSSSLKKAEKILSDCESKGITVLVPGTEEFPSSLLDLEAPPPILYCRGASQPSPPAVAVVGTRSPSRYGKRCARRLGQILAEQDFEVISGLALGCDTAAHRGCMEVGGQTGAVLAHGLDEIHPRKNASLAKEILSQGGSLWSEYPPSTHPQKHQYVQRNRLQAGLTSGVIVVEAGPDSGTLHTARFALEQEKILGCLAPQDKKERRLQSGNDKLLENGAYSVHDEEDVTRLIGLLRDESSKN